jgi:hypothetical protein
VKAVVVVVVFLFIDHLSFNGASSIEKHVVKKKKHNNSGSLGEAAA